VASKEYSTTSLRPYLELYVSGSPQFNPPTARIDSIVPGQVIQNFHPQVAFYGSGWDNDEGGQSIATWEWASSLNGQIGTTASFTRSPASLAVGMHTITLRVEDNEEAWSPADTSYLEVRAPDATPPSWPNGAGILGVEDLANGGSVKLYWNAASDVNPPIRYNVYHSASSPPFSGTCLNDVEWIPGLDYACTFVVQGLSVDVPYYFGVRAEDLVGNEDDNTAELCGTPTQGSAVSCTPTDDAYVTNAFPDANFGSSTLLRYGPNRISYLRFTVPDLGEVASAELVLVAATAGDTATVWPVTSTTWEEETLTWNTRPFLGGTAIDGISAQDPGQYYIADLSSHVTTPGAFSIAVNGTSATGGAFHSKEHAVEANRPTLVVVFRGDVVSPTQVVGLTCARDETSLLLSWQASTDNVGVTGYRVHRGSTPGFLPGPGSLLITTTETFYSDQGVLGDPESDHYYLVTAFDTAGNESSPSDRVGEKEYELTD
jgi:hypothetical protein